VFAKADDILDYANSIGQIDNHDTYNYVVNKTSDGGYVVGGATQFCVEYWGVGRDKIILSGTEEDNIKIIPDEVCMNDDSGVIPKGVTLNADEPLLLHRFEPVNYIAKFKKNGTKQWSTLVDSIEEPILISETANDYRLLTRDNKAYTVSKSGERGEVINYEIVKYENDSYNGIKFGANGYLYVAYSDWIERYDLAGKYAGHLGRLPDEPRNYDETITSYHFDDLTMNDDGIYATRNIHGSAINSGQTDIVRISLDFSTVSSICVFQESDGGDQILSADSEGNVLARIDTYYAIDNLVALRGCSYQSFDKDGNLLARKEKSLDGCLSNNQDEYGFMDGYLVYDDYGGKIIRKYNKYFEVEFVHAREDAEIINDLVVLDDGSVIVVGASSESNDMYEITGAANGIQIRLGGLPTEPDAEPVPIDDGGVTNPKTFDGLELFAVMGLAIVIMAGFAARKVFVRR
jgi:hypothetical protein